VKGSDKAGCLGIRIFIDYVFSKLVLMIRNRKDLKFFLNVNYYISHI